MAEQKIIEQLEKLIDIGIALSSEITTEDLLEKILIGAKSIAGSDGCTIFLFDDNQMRMEIIHSDSLGIKLGSKKATKTLPKIPLYLADGSKNYHNVVCYAYHTNKTVNIEDAYQTDEFDFSGTRKFDEQYHYHSQSFLAIPLKNHHNEIVGILQLINALDKDSGEIIAFDYVTQHFVEALASQAAIVLTKQALIQNMEHMFEALIQLIATAIDDKSPHTGGHCRRVPELTMMIAEAAHNAKQGYLKDFTMTNADRYELKIAGWLHDCGKITTPEYIVDKATKLETIYERIELIEARFEIIKREAEIHLLTQQIAEPNRIDFHQQSYEQNLQQLEEEWAFIQCANKGTEFMSEQDQAKIVKIAQRTYLSQGKLLPLLSEDEVNNLCIARGTLNSQERKIINHHINMTIAMLEKIPFPKHLKNVPEYAGGHHEQMNGTGYPKGLTREQMSIQARVMAVADIFEALTANDRPYKQAKKLSESLAILKNMKKGQHIDPDIYDVFIEQKVYLQYAHKFLDEQQIDVN